jgi:hypothetical protein
MILEESIPCNCHEGATENTADTFVRTVRKSELLNISDFRNSLERSSTLTWSNCSEYCGLLGVSVDIWNEQSRQFITDRFLYTQKIAPKNKKKLCIMKFKDGSGLTKHTPDQVVYNEFHYDLYKSENFTLDSFDVVETIVAQL